MDDSEALGAAAVGRCVATLWTRQQAAGAPAGTPEPAARAEFLGETAGEGARNAWRRELEMAESQGRLQITEDDEQEGVSLLRAVQAVGTRRQVGAAAAASRDAGRSAETSDGDAAGRAGFKPPPRWAHLVPRREEDAAWWDALEGELYVARLFLQDYQIREADWEPKPGECSWRRMGTREPQAPAEGWRSIFAQKCLQASSAP